MFDSFVHNGQHKIHYYRTGQGKKTLLLLHGFTDCGLCWPRLVESLQDAYDLVMMDSRGHGLSDAPETGYDVFSQAGDAACIIQTLTLDKPVLIGHSMGAEIAAITAGEYPDLVKAIILEDPPWLDMPILPTPAEMQQRVDALRKSIETSQASSLEQLVAFCKLENPGWDDSERIPWATAKLQMKTNAAVGIIEPLPGWREVAGKIRCPVLLLRSDPDKGGIVTESVALEASRTWNDSQVVHIPNAGHNIRREQFEQYLDAVIRFLRMRD